jgi:hypothetical protein
MWSHWYRARDERGSADEGTADGGGRTSIKAAAPGCVAPTMAQKLLREAYEALLALGGLAKKGSVEAASEFHCTLATAVQSLRFLCPSRPELVSEARQHELQERTRKAASQGEGKGSVGSAA